MKMSKWLFSALCLFLSVPLFSQNRVIYNAGLLNSDDKTQLEKSLEKIASDYGFDLVIVTEKNIGTAAPMDYADDFFDYNGYGLGENRDGCLFLQVTGSRDYWFSTSGRGIKILNSSAFNKLESSVLPFLKDDDPAGAYRTFINRWELFLALDAKGRSYNIFYAWNFVIVIIGFALSFLTGLIIVFIWKAKMNTALPKKEADFYIVSGSQSFSLKQDRFLYSSVSKSKKETSSSLGGGGSHTSSSGRSHGGGGGKY
jgi:uncharacterized protein